MEIIKHTDIEYTFRLSYKKAPEVKPGQFFEMSIPMVGEAPISVSGIGEDSLDFTIRKVGLVTNEIFERQVDDRLFIRGPYGNGFDVSEYRGKELIIVAGGTGLSPVRGVVDYFANHLDEVKSFTLVVGFKSPEDVLFKADIKSWKEKFDVILTVDAAGDDYEGHRGFVTEFVPELIINDLDDVQVIVVGPPMMMHYTVLAFLKRNIAKKNIWISQERNMSCGIGKCGHCKIDDAYICLDGPVFNYTKGEHLID
jgi:anaerobic sulfite reductase subunit B